MTRPTNASAGGRFKFKSSHRRLSLHVSHRQVGGPAERMEREEARERYIAPPKRVRR